MKRRTLIVISTLLIVMAIALPAVTYAQGGNGQQNCGGMGRQNRGQGMGNPCAGQGNGLPPATTGDLPDEVVEAMIAGIMDEYNAYNTYAVVIDQFGSVRPFTSIQRAEAQHIAAWERIFNRYGIAVPEATEVVVPQFATLSDACVAAADAEIANFGLYDDMLDTLSDYPDMVRVVTRLRDASQYNHLPAFERCAGQ